MTTEKNKKRRNIGPSGPLYNLLMERLPGFHMTYGGHPRLDIYGLAEALQASPQSLYQILPSGDNAPVKNLSVRLARKFIALSETQEGVTPLTLLDLEPFLPS